MELYETELLLAKTTVLHRNEINTVKQLNYFIKINLLMPRFINSLCVITVKLNTLTDVPYQMTVDCVFLAVDPDERVIMELQCI